MGVYTPRRQAIPNGLDEVGLGLGLPRLEEEELAAYRQRLILETRVPSGASQDELVAGISRLVGAFDEPLLEVDLILDASGNPLASDPYFEITSTRVRAYHNHAAGDAGLDFTLTIDRASDWFVDALQTALTASTYFSSTVLASTYQYELLQELQWGSSTKTVDVSVLRKSFTNDLGVKYIKTLVPQSAFVFSNEEASLAAVDTDGDYFVDYVNGVLFSHSTQQGGVFLTHAAFPYLVRKAAVRVVPVSDPDLEFRTRELAIDETGQLLEHNRLTPFGAWLANQIYAVAPTGWGK